MGPVVCVETSETNYHPILRKNPEQRSSRPYRGGSLKYGRIARRTANDVFAQRPMRLNPEVQRRRVCIKCSVIMSGGWSR